MAAVHKTSTAVAWIFILFKCLTQVSAFLESDAQLATEIEILRSELVIAITELETDIQNEEFKLQELMESCALSCQNKSSATSVPDSLASQVWNMKQVASRCENRVDRMLNQIQSAKNKFQSETAKTEVNKGLDEINKTYTELLSEVERNSNEIEELQEVLDNLHDNMRYLNNMDENTIRQLLTQASWRPSVVPLKHRHLKLRISACPVWTTNCSVYDIAATSEGIFVVTYLDQPVLRKFGYKGVLLSEYRFPWNIAAVEVINTTHIIVGAPDKNALIIMSVDRGFYVEQYITVGGECGVDISMDVDSGHYLVGCRQDSSIRIYDKSWNLTNTIPHPKPEILSLLHFQMYRSSVPFNNILPQSPRDAVWNKSLKLWYMVSFMTNEVQSVPLYGFIKKTLFYIRQPTCVAMLESKKLLVVGSAQGFIYLAKIE